MITYETSDGSAVKVCGADIFGVSINEEFFSYTRERLTELRHIIDQALNTSAEELNDDVA